MKLYSLVKIIDKKDLNLISQNKIVGQHLICDIKTDVCIITIIEVQNDNTERVLSRASDIYLGIDDFNSEFGSGAKTRFKSLVMKALQDANIPEELRRVQCIILKGESSQIPIIKDIILLSIAEYTIRIQVAY